MKIKLTIVFAFIMHLYSIVEAKQIFVTKSTDNIDAPEEGMLRYSISNAKSNDTILFLVDSVGLEGELRISYKSLIIDGGNGVILDGGQNSRIFNISFDSFTKITLSNLKIQNGYIGASDLAWGGGFYASGTGEGLVVDRCIFEGNIAHTDFGDGQGGAVRTNGGVFTNCYFFNNKVTGSGNSNSGGAIMATGEAKIMNCVIAGNYAKYAGGISAISGTLIYNCTVTQNNSEFSPGGIDVNSDAYTKVKNCIVYNNYAYNGTISNLGSGGSANYFNCALNEGDFMVGSNNNIALTENPFSLNQGIDSLSLKETAQSIDAGTIINIDFLVTDIIESSRISGVTIDIGAYEYYQKPNKWVITNSEDNTNPEEGMLRYALQNAVNGDTIVFEVNTIFADTTFLIDNKSLIIRGNETDRTKIIGDSSFSILELQFKDTITRTIIENLEFTKGYGTNPAINTSHSNLYITENKNLLRNCRFYDNYASSGSAISIFQFNIVNCYFENNTSDTATYGSVASAIYTKNSIVDSCIFINNNNFSDYRYSAGALYADNSDIKNCSFFNNSAYGGDVGGAVYIKNGLVENCTFEANYLDIKTNGGGALYCSNSSVVNCKFLNNKGGDYWGGAYNAGAVESRGSNTFIGCLFSNNSSMGAGALVGSANDKIINCTFVNNESTSDWGGINLIEGESQITIKNSIVYGNMPFNFKAGNIHGGNVATLKLDATYSAIEDTLLPGEGNIRLNSSPLQPLQASDFYLLSDTSVCINAGDTTEVSSLLMATDIFGNNRINGNAIDVGAVEHYDRLAPIINWPTTNNIVYGNNLINTINLDGSANIAGDFQFNLDTTFFPDAGLSYIQTVFSPHEDSILAYKSIVENLEIQVDKVELSVSAVDTTVILGDVEPAYRLIYSGFVLDEDEDVLDQKPTAHVNNYSELGVGAYYDVVEVSGGRDSNYDFNYDSGTLTIISNVSALKNISFDLSVFPNPTSDVIIIENYIGVIEYSVTSLTGEQLINGIENTEQLLVDLSNMKTGLYILSLRLNGERIEYKVIKQ